MAHETTYILLLRGINVGGRNKLPTAPFCEQLKSEGFSNVRSYLASGNLLLDSAEPVDVIQEKIRALIRRQITEEIPLLLLEAGSFLREADLRPAWWRKPMARRDVLFLLDEADPTVVFRRIREMPLREENRIIVREGLKAVAATDNPGLCSLMELCGLVPSEITAYQIGYVIGPCLNAGGRLESAKIGLRMLLETDPEKAEQAAVHLKELNDERKDMTARGVEEARLQAEGELADQKVLVVYLPDCHESVAGIIAGRLREEYYRPSIVLTDSAAEDCIKGSGRSIEGYHMFHALEGVSDLLVRFGGRPMAAGLTLKRENEALLRQRLNDAADLTENDLTEKIWIDAAMPFSYITEDLVRSLSLLEPCGQGNERPLFAQKNVKIRSVRVVGRNRNVVRLSLTGEDGFTIDGVAFTDGDRFLEELKERRVFDILYYPAINEYMGRNTLQIVIRGWKFRT